MTHFCGLDFGTSNSTIGISLNNTCQLVPLENDKKLIRSAIFCDNENKSWVFGQEGIDHYLHGFPGRLMMALKTVLGSSLMDDETIIFGESVAYTAILGHFMRRLKTLAEKSLGHELTHAVLGRPVHFYDHDIQKDKLAQDTLEKVAHDIGFKEIAFQYEPIAAALAYETSIKTEKLALIIDMGGGTSDFTIIRLHPNCKSTDRSRDVLANCGIHIAGTDFDKLLSIKQIMPLLGMGSLIKGSSSDIEVPNMFYHDLTTWHTLNSLYTHKTVSQVKSILTVAHHENLISRLLHVLTKRAGHHILDSVENCKQKLSDENEVAIDLAFIENHLTTTVLRTAFNDIIAEDVQRLINTIHETVKTAAVQPHEIDALFYTGGTTKIPMIRDNINQLFPNAEIIQGDAFGSVGIGLTLDAQRKFS